VGSRIYKALMLLGIFFVALHLDKFVFDVKLLLIAPDDCCWDHYFIFNLDFFYKDENPKQCLGGKNLTKKVIIQFNFFQ
jgi:hypothetical protein